VVGGLIIKPEDKIGGVEAKRVRDALLKLGHSREWAPAELAGALGVSPEISDRVFTELTALGYLEAGEQEPSLKRVSSPGLRLLRASAAKPLKRSTADDAVEGLRRRAQEINDNPMYAWRVRRVLLFGSYLTEKERLGDLDVAVEMSPRFSDEKLNREKFQERFRFGQSTRTFKHEADRYGFPQNEVLSFLRARSRTISLTEVGDESLRRGPVRVAYQDPRLTEVLKRMRGNLDKAAPASGADPAAVATMAKLLDFHIARPDVPLRDEEDQFLRFFHQYTGDDVVNATKPA
jgi:hypothetical protein